MPTDESDGSRETARQRERILREAAEWLTKAIDNRMSSPGEAAAFEAWLAEHPDHREAFQKIERLWQGTGDLPVIKERQKQASKAITRRDIGKAVLALAAVGLGARYLYTYPFADFRTGQGERKTIQAADNSTFELAPETRMSATFTEAGRRVELFEGEAYFKVFPDGRPFTVVAGMGDVRALGTAFSVRYRDGAGRVVVEEHATEVRLGSHASVVGAGEEIAYRSDLGSIRKVDPEDVLAWRSGRLVFDGETLGEVVDVLNLWHTGRILVMDRALAGRPVTLIIDVDRIGSVGAQLRSALPLRVVQVTPFLMFLFPTS